MRKKIACLLIGIGSSILSSGSFAQVPDKMNYQAIVRNSENMLVRNGTLGVRIRILRGSSDAAAVYEESHKVKTNENGLLTLEIGAGTIVEGNFATIDWSKGTYFIETGIDINGGENYSIILSSQILSIPYAFYSRIAENGLTDGNQSISGTKMFTDTIIARNGLNANNKNIKNVADPVTDGDAVNKAYVDLIKEYVASELSDAGLNGHVTDIDGNQYRTIKIGNQVWMAENLKTTKFNDGTPIPLVEESWNLLNSAGRCYFNNDSAKYKNIYGALYNWYTIKDLCPTGWHVPSDEEWTILADYLGTTNVAGGEMKEMGYRYWKLPNFGATNGSGFAARPGGHRDISGGFGNDIGSDGFWWSSTELNYSAWYRKIDYNYNAIFPDYVNKGLGYSVRCLKN